MPGFQEMAEREKEIERLQKLLNSVKGFPEGSPLRAEAYIKTLEDMLQDLTTEPQQGECWDFSNEKSWSVFAQDESLILRPIGIADLEFYIGIRTQYSVLCRVMVETEAHKSESWFINDACQPEDFFCVIESVAEQKPIGYIGLKDTRNDLWEIAIELDNQCTGKGYGPNSVRLFLNEIYKITGRAEYQARIDTNNLPSQKCFEKIGAELVGLCDGPILKLPDEKKRFEDKNLNLIDNHMRELASRLGVEPRKLLSHVLDYRLTCPL